MPAPDTFNDPFMTRILSDMRFETDEAKIDHLTKVVRVLWHEVERMRAVISVSHNEVVIKLDATSFVMKRNGSIALHGNQIVVQGAGTVSVKASGPLILKGSTIQQN
jgi:hypothetical protein